MTQTLTPSKQPLVYRPGRNGWPLKWRSPDTRPEREPASEHIGSIVFIEIHRYSLMGSVVTHLMPMMDSQDPPRNLVTKTVCEGQRRALLKRTQVETHIHANRSARRKTTHFDQILVLVVTALFFDWEDSNQPYYSS